MARGSLLVAALSVMLLWSRCALFAEVVQPLEATTEAPELKSPSDIAADSEPEEVLAEEEPAPSQDARPRREKLARIWANEPPLVRLAREKFGDEFNETDARFFAAVAANEWADFRPSSETQYDAKQPSSWKDAPDLAADRIAWLCTEPAASRLVPSLGIAISGASVVGEINLYRTSVPFTIAFNKCLLDSGIDVRGAKLQELSITDSCSHKVNARGVEVVANVYVMRTTVFGGLHFVEAEIGGDLDFDGGLAFHATTLEEGQKPGVAIDLFDAKVDGDVKVGQGFTALGTVRVTGARIGRSVIGTGGKFAGLGGTAFDAERTQIGRSIMFNDGVKCIGSFNIRRAHLGGDLELAGAKLDGGQYSALDADLVDIAGQVQLNNGLNAAGEVRFVNAVIGKDFDCDNGHFINPNGNALSLDTAEIGRSLRMGHYATGATEQDTDLHPGFVSQSAVRLYGTHVHQDLLATGGHFEMPEGTAIVANNLRVAGRMLLQAAEAKGMVDFSSAEIEDELSLAGSLFDGTKAYNKIAIWANGLKVHGHLNCNDFHFDKTWPFRVDGQATFKFATIGMAWDLEGAEFHHPRGDALDASDCHVGSYVNLHDVELDGRVTFSRAKIDGMWIFEVVKNPHLTTLDMRFAHVWVLKDSKLDDWPPAGQLQLEGFVYEHFDDDSPLSVEDRLVWLRRQYASPKSNAGNAVTSNVPPSAFQAAGHAASSGGGTDNAITPVDFESADASTPHMAEPEAMAPVEDDIFAPLPQPQSTAKSSMAPPADVQIPAESQPAMPAPVQMVVDPTELAATEAENTAAPTTAPVVPPDPAGRRYITQPYTQLASVYRAIGQDEQANAVLVARAERLGELAAPLSAQGLWYRYFGRLIGYGYEPFRAIKIGGAIVLFGALIFTIGARRGLMAETKLAEHVLSQENEAGVVSPTYPRFNPFVYSLDVFLPFADLHQRVYWIPGERPSKPRVSRNCLMHIGPYSVKWSGVLRSYLWFQTLAGWTLCTLLAAAVTGIVQS